MLTAGPWFEHRGVFMCEWGGKARHRTADLTIAAWAYRNPVDTRGQSWAWSVFLPNGKPFRSGTSRNKDLIPFDCMSAFAIARMTQPLPPASSVWDRLLNGSFLP